MSSASDLCPLCRNRYGGKSRRSGSSGPSVYFDCQLCGQYGVAGNLIGAIDVLSLEQDRLSGAQRARLVKFVHDRARLPFGSTAFLLTREDLDYAIMEFRLPTPAEQAANIVRYLGDRLVDSDDVMNEIPIDFYITIGSPSPRRAGHLVEQLIAEGFLRGQIILPHIIVRSPSGSIEERVLGVSGLDLTLRGWERYESEKRGRFAGSYGFVALKFNESVLDGLLRDHARPFIKEKLGFDLIDMRDVSRAGIIDNVMREKIRDAAFVLADLSHDNPGAYWEAGYAEGLGKPVLYICERAKFAQSGTHFDTSHMTTVMWESGAEQTFFDELAATLRRSLEPISASR